MATITKSSISGSGDLTVSETTLGASDTFVYVRGKTKFLYLNNETAGALTVNIDGDGATTQFASGVGSVDLTGGFTTVALAAGDVRIIPLDTIASYLAGTIAVTGGTGIVASILEE